MPLGRATLPKILAVLMLAGIAGAGAIQPADAAPDPNAMAPTITRTACPGGVSAIHTIPARGFNPLTATNAELNANNYPARPPATHAKAYAQWKKFVSTPAALASACPPLQSANRKGAVLPSEGVTSTATSNNWSGYMAHGVKYTEAEATWSVPAAQETTAGWGYSSSWVGIGLGQSSYYELMQAGTESDLSTNGSRTYYIWFQIYPDMSKCIPLDYNVAPGDNVGVHVAYTSSGPQFHIWDSTTGFNTTFIYNGSWGDDGHAEWIYERPEIPANNYKLPYLAEAPPTFYNAQAVTGGHWQSLADASDVAFTMRTCGGARIMAYPGPISGTSFYENWESWGDAYVC